MINSINNSYSENTVNTSKTANPLTNYFRTYKIYTPLPSGTSYYNNDTIEFLEDGTIGVMPMTGKDELILKNPDSLLNGEALVHVINSCVPAIKDVKVLLANDVEAIITAIRCATYNDGLETQLKCPACENESIFKLNLQYAIDNMEFLDKEYVVNLDTGLSVFLKPYGYKELMKGLHSQFEQSKITRSIENQELSDEDKMKIFSKVFKDVAKLTVELMQSSIIKIVDESKELEVTDKSHIAEFIQNIDRTSVNSIEELIKEINQIGVKRSFTAKCEDEKCGHIWENNIDFNPVNFS